MSPKELRGLSGRGSRCSFVSLSGQNRRGLLCDSLGSTVQEDGGTEQEIARRIQSGWNSWKKITGVVCDRKVPDKVKGELHKLKVRPAILYGLETVPLTKSQERKLEVAEMRMMRYEVGVTRSDKIKNETTREILGIERYGEKNRESRLSWFGATELNLNIENRYSLLSDEDLNIDQIKKQFNDIIKEAALEVDGIYTTRMKSQIEANAVTRD
ncbi:uncharacterized protein LOC134765304 [Penaeus indicus]|uniref:uncharacterized protein LOC134765304 n=1 Tax=Penaeus indicus TaxID=29960 RepID=UPI00300CE201